MVDFSIRVEHARAYLEFLQRSTSHSWLDLYNRHQAGLLSLPQSVVLVHPSWLDAQKTPSREKRSFNLTFTSLQRCEAEKIWGYECTFESPIHQDHYFPYSLGGPTLPANALFLCKLHNDSKAGDIHLLNWTPETFTWLSPMIQEVRVALQRMGIDN